VAALASRAAHLRHSCHGYHRHCAGGVGTTLGRGWAAAGHFVSWVVRNPDDERYRALRETGARLLPPGPRPAVAALVLATPWAGAQPAIAACGDLRERVLIDCTNPLGPNFELVVGHTRSGAEEVAGWARGARVVKAFNTVGFNIMANPVRGGRHAFLPVVGDDAAAKQVALQLARDLRFDAQDLGSLANARLTEAFALMWIKVALQQGFGREFAFGMIRD
jgi:predicted dinucleotide-binding enzyme